MDTDAPQGDDEGQIDGSLDVADAWLVISVGSVPGGRLQAAVVGAAQGTFARVFRRAAGLHPGPALEVAATRRLADRNLDDRERQRIRRLAGLPEA